jgi:hypothetical protein
MKSIKFDLSYTFTEDYYIERTHKEVLSVFLFLRNSVILYMNKKFWEDVILFLFFHYNLSAQYDSRKKPVSVLNEVNKAIQFPRLQCWHYWWEGFIKHAAGIASDAWRLVRAFKSS